MAAAVKKYSQCVYISLISKFEIKVHLYMKNPGSSEDIKNDLLNEVIRFGRGVP